MMKSSSPTKIIISGASGKMGRTLIGLALRDKKFNLVGAFEKESNPAVGQDIGFLVGQETRGVCVANSLESIISATQVVVDFTSPQATLRTAELCAKYKKGIVIGTTGFSPKEE